MIINHDDESYKKGIEAFNEAIQIDELIYTSRIRQFQKSSMLELPEDERIHKIASWFLGFDSAARNYFYEKYQIEKLHKDIRELIKSHGLDVEIKDCIDEDYPVIKTKEGYLIRIC